MEITTKEFEQFELVTLKGRVDSVEAQRLVEAMDAAYRRGKYKLVIDMSQLEYMSSAGFRALAMAQRNSKRHSHGEVILTQIPGTVREALEIVGFSNFFTTIDPLSLALEYAGRPIAGASPTDVQPISPNGSAA